MTKKTTQGNKTYKFYISLSIIGILATATFAYILAPFTDAPSTETILTITGFYAALLGVVEAVKGRDSIEYSWNQRVLSRVCIDLLIMVLAGTFIFALFPQMALVSIVLVIIGIGISDMFVRHAVIRKIEG